MPIQVHIEELCSLKTADIDLDKDIFSITESKTEAGVRVVPIHSKLKPLIKSLVESSADGYVLSEIGQSKFGQRSNAIGKRFGHLKSKLGYSRKHTCVSQHQKNTHYSTGERRSV